MYDHSYSVNALKGVLRKVDFLPVRGRSVEEVDAYRRDLVTRANASAASNFNGINPIEVFHLKKKSTYRISNLHDDIVVRKLSNNLHQAASLRTRGRDFVVENLRLHMEEGVPYRLYRIDVKSFYESFTLEGILRHVTSVASTSPISVKHVEVLLRFYAALGGTGIPRGMAISAVLSDLMMSDFDLEIAQLPSVYFYARYVDDIVVLTNGTEADKEFVETLAKALPAGLKLNASKQRVTKLLPKVKALLPPLQSLCSVEYLGYDFVVRNPLKGSDENEKFRQVKVEIARRKVEKMKSRIVRSFRDFAANSDFDLLRDRITFLTSNFRITDKNTGKQRSAGIYYSYPQLSEDATSLVELDAFLRHAILSRQGRVFSHSSVPLSGQWKRALLRHSFVRGHREKSYVYFSMPRISDIQKCWKYE